MSWRWIARPATRSGKRTSPALPESEYSGGNNTWHGYASSTPATDGTRLYVFFGRSGVYCLDLKDGAEVWHADVGSKTTGWGSGNSVVLFENLVIVNASIESTAMYALDKDTGKEVWKVERRQRSSQHADPRRSARCSDRTGAQPARQSGRGHRGLRSQDGQGIVALQGHSRWRLRVP